MDRDVSEACHQTPANNNMRDCWPAVGLVIKILILAVVYAAIGRAALWFAVPPGFATGAFPPAGIAMAAVLLCGYRIWPGVMLGVILLSMSGGADLSRVANDLVCVGVGSTLQALFGAWLIRRFVGFPTPLEHATAIGKFLLLSGPVACLTAATWSIFALWIFGFITHDIAYNWFTWWIGDTIGVLVFLPLMLIVRGEPRHIWRRRRVSVGLPLVCAWIAAVGVFYFAEAQRQSNIQLEFERRTDALQDAIAEQIERYLEVVHAITMFHQSSKKVERHEFKVFVNRGLARHPGVLALEWIPRVQATSRPALEQAARDNATLETDPHIRQGLENFTIKKWVPDRESTSEGRWEIYAPGEGTEYFPVYFLEPYHGNESALGIDLYSNPGRRVGLDAARDTGQPAATAPITLAQETNNEFGFLLAVPIYAKGKPLDTLADRRTYLTGYATGAFRVSDIVHASLSASDRAVIGLVITDASVPDNEQNLLYGEIDDNQADPSPEPSRLRRTASREVAGRTWQLKFTALDDYPIDGHLAGNWAVLAATFLLTMMVCGAMLLVTARSDAQIRESEQRFRSMFELAAVGIARVAPDGKFLRVNQKLGEILGYSLEEVMTLTFQDITHPDDLAVDLHNVRKMLAGSITTYDREKRYIKKNGEIVWAKLTVALVSDTSGNPLYFIAIVEDISQRRQAEGELEDERDVLRRLIELQEAERRLVAYDIHDGFAQDVVGAQMHLQAVLGRATSDDNDDAIQYVVELLNKAIKECRRMIRDLRPMILDESGVVDAIRHLVAEENQNSALTVAFTHDIQFDRLDSQLEGAIFRIVQESLNNVRRHANTDHAAVELTQRNGSLDVVVRDQGVGFDKQQVPHTCFGLRGILERARLFGGTAEFTSTPGEGTVVSVQLPIDTEASS